MEQSELEQNWIGAELWNSEEKCRAMFDMTNDGILIVDVLTKKLLKGNTTICSMLGYTKEEIESLTIYDIHPAKDIPHILGEFEKLAKREITCAECITVLKKDKTIFYADISAFSIVFAGAHCLFGIFRDITKRRQVEEALKNDANDWSSLFDAMSDGISIHDERYTIIKVNRTLCQMLGKRQEDLIGKKCYDIFHGTDNPIAYCPIELTMKTRMDEHAEFYETALNKWLFVSSSPILNNSGEITRLVHIVRDISERKQMERMLRKAEDRYRTLFSGADEGIFIMSAEGELIEFNDSFAQMHGYSNEEMQVKNLSDLDTPKTYQMVPERTRRVLAGEALTFEVEHYHRDGHVLPIEVSACLVTLDGKSCIQSFHRDITERKRAEEALQEREENFRAFFNTINDMIVVASPDGKIIYANPAMMLRLGYSYDEFMSMHVLDIHPAEKRQEAGAIFAAMFRGELDICPLPLQSKAGALIPVETRVWFGKWSGADCIFGICKDLTREQEAIQKFNRLFNSNPTPMAVSIAPERIFTDVNEAFLNVLGYSRSEIIGKTSAELGLFLRPDKHQKIVDQLQTDGHVSNCELKIRRKDGLMLDGLFSGEIIESQEKKYLLTVMIDQTERKRMFEDLERHRRHLEDLVRERTLELENKTITLQELNTALKVLLKQREDDKNDMEERFLLNIRNLILPYIEQIKKGHFDIRQRSYIEIIETHLNEITKPLLKNIRQFNLTPTELKVAMLIRQGKSTKEIAEVMGTAAGSINVHRKNIRSKFGLTNRRANLISYLESLESR